MAVRFRERGFSGTLNPEISDREKAHGRLARRAAAEGMVLLENNGILPLKEGTPVALYGGGARYTIKGGTGSGSVNNRCNVNIDEGLRNAGLRITTDAWLDEYDAVYERNRTEWMQQIYRMSEPGDFFSLYNAYSAHPMPMPKGGEPVRTEAKTAVYVVSRISGESADRHAKRGDYYLSETEEEELTALSALYPDLILVLNAGGVMDLSFLERIPVAALLVMSQAGMEGGNALGDVLTGKVNPCGRLTDTWACRYEDYPCWDTFSHNNGNLYEEVYAEGIYVGYRYFDSFGVRPRYPFGYGRSYTKFTLACEEIRVDGENGIVSVRVTNTGGLPGKQVAQLYAACPPGKRPKERKRLVAFGKTGLLMPGESETLTLTFPLELLESYDTGHASYYLDGGVYGLFLGENAGDCRLSGKLSLQERTVLQRLSRICPLQDALKELRPAKEAEEVWQDYLEKLYRDEPVACVAMDDAAERLRKRLEGWQMRAEERSCPEAEAILGKMTRQEKARLVCGQPSAGSSEVIGAAAVHVPGAAGETTTGLEHLGIGELILADGPAGLRLQQRYEEDPQDGTIYQLSRYEALQNRFFGTEFLHEGAVSHYQFCSAIPVGTLLAQTFDTELMKEIGMLIGREMKEFGVTLWLAPGMNIHRNPLCGRNFEYYSEDPVVSGYMAAAITEGVQRFEGIGTTIKHFAGNNQEDNRMGVTDTVSERALREIYLKGFELAVKMAQPMAIMTAYSKINGIHAANNYDLCTVAARREWGFGGIIMTDWLTTNDGHGASAVKCIQAGNDLIMPGNESDIREICEALDGERDLYLEEKDLDRCALRILRTILESDVTMKEDCGK